MVDPCHTSQNTLHVMDEEANVLYLSRNMRVTSVCGTTRAKYYPRINDTGKIFITRGLSNH